MTEIYIRSLEAQIIGRVFTYDGTIHFVLGTDPQTNMARCSRRSAGSPGITYLSMEDVRQILIDQSGSLIDSEADEIPNAKDIPAEDHILVTEQFAAEVRGQNELREAS